MSKFGIDNVLLKRFPIEVVLTDIDTANWYDGSLTLGNRYNVTTLCRNGQKSASVKRIEYFYEITDDNGEKVELPAANFMSVDEYRDSNINKIL